MYYVIVGKVEGQPDMYYYERSNPPEAWTQELKFASIYRDVADVYGVFDRIRRSMEIHLGRDLKTGKPILDSMTKQPIKRIDLPYHIFQLLALNSLPGPDRKMEGKATIFICELKIEPTEHYIEVEGHHPQAG